MSRRLTFRAIARSVRVHARRPWVLVLALVVSMAIPPAAAVALSRSEVSNAGSVALVRAAVDRTAAMTAAVMQGVRVEDLSSRTETTSTYANPDGTWTTEAYSGVVRSKTDGDSWVPVDPTIQETSGSYEPKAAPFSADFSDGGDHELGSISSDSGAKISVGWPTKLPAPSADGTELTYPDAVPNGDLVLGSYADGFDYSIVLDHAPAADASQLEYRVPITFSGAATPSIGADGAITVKDGDDVVATMTPPLMWDDANQAPDGERHAVTASVQGQGDSRTLVLKPNMDYLRDPSTKYPVTVDPTVTMNVAYDTWMDSAGPTTSQITSPELRVGSNNLGINKDRSYVVFDLSGLQGMPLGVLTSAQVQVTDFATGSCSGGNVRMSQVTSIWNPSTVTWSSQPTTTSTGSSVSNAAFGSGTCAGEGPMTFGATTIMNSWAGSNGANNYGVQLKSDSESAASGYRRLRSAEYADPTKAPKLIVTYNAYPTRPTGLTVSPGNNSYASATATVTNPTLSAKVSDPDGGPVRGYFELYSGSSLIWSGTSSWGNSGDAVSVAVPAGLLSNGNSYTAAAYSQDAALKSQSAALRVVKVDTTAPTVSLPPTRIFQTSSPAIPATAHYLSGGDFETVQVTGSNGIPLTDVSAVRMVIYASASSAASGYVQAYPTPSVGHQGPDSMDLPVNASGTTSATITTPVSSDGTVDLRFVGAGAVDLAVDATGYFSGGGLPTEPLSPAVITGDGGAVVTWNRPSSDGRDPISSFAITRQPGSVTQTAGAADRGIELRGLSNSGQYTWAVAATNVAGNGPASVPVSATMTGTVGPVAISSDLYPAGATVQSVTASSDATFSWLDPNSTTSTYEYVEDAGTSVVVGSSTKSIAWYPQAGAHTLKVRAVPATGTPGPWATTSFVVVDRPSVPVPTDVAGVAGPDGSVTLSGVVRTGDGDGGTANFYAIHANGQAVGGTPYASSSVDTSGFRAAISLNPADVSTGEVITWWMTTCMHTASGPVCSTETSHQQVTVPAVPSAPATTHLSIPQSTMTSRTIAEAACSVPPCPAPPAGLFVGANQGSTYASLLNFDLSGLPPLSRITSATLRLHSLSGGSSISLAVDPMLQAWDGSTSSATVDDNAGEAAWDGSVAPGQAVDVDLTQLAAAWAAGDIQKVGVRLRSETSGGLTFGAPTDPLTTVRPTLDITYVPVTAPSVVRNLVASAGDGGVRVTWHEPVDAGSVAELDGYQVTVKNSGGAMVAQATSQSTSITFTGLTNGTNYTVSVAALGGGGTGQTVTAVFTPAAISSASSAIAATAAYAQARAALSNATASTVAQATSGLASVTSFATELTKEVGSLLSLRGLTQQLSGTEATPMETLPTVGKALVRNGPSGTVLVTAAVSTTKSVTDENGNPKDAAESHELTYVYTQQSGGLTLNDVEDADAQWVPDQYSGNGDEVEDQPSWTDPDGPSAQSSSGTQGALYQAMKQSNVVRAVPAMAVMPPLKTVTSTSRAAMVKWGLQHYQDSHEFSPNCTNFASRVLYHGAQVPMIHRYHMYWYPSHDNRNWYKYYGEAEFGYRTMDASFSWGGSSNFHEFLKTQGSNLVSYFNQAVSGDIVFYVWKEDGKTHHHTAVVSSNNSTQPANFFVMQSQHDYAYRLVFSQMADIRHDGGTNLGIYIIHVTSIS